MIRVILTGSNPYDKRKVTGIGAVIKVLLGNESVEYNLNSRARGQRMIHRAHRKQILLI